eukprot:Gb_09379 [translate_table: standard]
MGNATTMPNTPQRDKEAILKEKGSSCTVNIKIKLHLSNPSTILKALREIQQGYHESVHDFDGHIRFLVSKMDKSTPIWKSHLMEYFLDRLESKLKEKLWKHPLCNYDQDIRYHHPHSPMHVLHPEKTSLQAHIDSYYGKRRVPAPPPLMTETTILGSARGFSNVDTLIGKIHCVQEVKEECDPEDDEEEEEGRGSYSRLMEELLEGIPIEDIFRGEDGLASLEGISLPSSPLITLASDESNRNTSLVDSINRHINRLTPTWIHQWQQHHIEDDEEETVKEEYAYITYAHMVTFFLLKFSSTPLQTNDLLGRIRVEF